MIRSNPFFRIWDPAVLNIFVECGLYETTDSATGQHIVRLKTSAVQEGVMLLCDEISPQETFQRMRDLDERIALRWIVPQEDLIGAPGDTMRRVWVRPKNSANIKIRTGHLVCCMSFFCTANSLSEIKNHFKIPLQAPQQLGKP